MVTALSEAALDVVLTQIDEAFEREGEPLRFRPVEALKTIYGDVADGPVRNQIFGEIVRWFWTRYGKQIEWDGIIGRIPVLLRGKLYLVQVPFVETETLQKLTDRFEGLPVDIAESFTFEEFNELGRKITAATDAVSRLYEIHLQDGVLDEYDRQIIRRALFDFEQTAIALQRLGDTQGAIFHAHAAAEKFMKVGLRRATGFRDTKRLGHDLRRVFRRLCHAQKRFAWLQSSVDALQCAAPDMEIRYSKVPRSIPDAVAAHNASLNICGTLAGTWLLDHQRGPTAPRFKPGEFYIDSARRTFLCKAVQNHKAVLIYFGLLLRRSVMAEITMDVEQCGMYMELSEPTKVAEVRARFEFQWRNRGKEITPEEAGAEITRGPEGSYATAILKIKK
jgi:HEPN domain-containing protein